MPWKTDKEVEEYLKDQEWFRIQEQRIIEKRLEEIKFLSNKNKVLIEVVSDNILYENSENLKILIMQNEIIKNADKINEIIKYLKEKYNYIV